MKLVEIAEGVTFPNAVELPNSTARPASKHVANKGGGNGTKKKNKDVPPVPVAMKTRDQQITAENQMIMVVSPTGKRRFVRMSEYA